jgi:hypothetical protein
MLQVCYIDVAYVLHIYWKCFIWMLRMFCNDFQVFFRYALKVFHMHVSSVSSVFIRMLQVLHIDVSKVD